MALSTDSLYRPVNSIKDKLENILDDLEDLKSSATIFGGVIGQQLPGSVQTLTNNVEAMLDGGPTSITGILDFLDNVPMGEIRTKSAAERREADRGMSQLTADLTPHMGNGPKSAVIQNESLNIEDFYRDEFKKKPSQFKESDYSWEAIKANPDIEATDLSGSGLFNEGFGSFDMAHYAEEAAANYADDPEQEDQNDTTELDESVSPDDWRNTLRECDPITFGPLNGNIAETGHLVD